MSKVNFCNIFRNQEEMEVPEVAKLTGKLESERKWNLKFVLIGFWNAGLNKFLLEDNFWLGLDFENCLRLFDKIGK